MTTKTTTEIITLMWVCSHNNDNANGTSYNKKRQQCTRWGSGNIEEESSCLCPQTWLFHPRQHLCRQCLLSSTVHCDVCVCVPYVYVCVYACVCASLFKSHYKALVRLYLSPLASAWSTLAFISHTTMIDSTWKISRWELPFKHAQMHKHTLAQLAQFRVSTVDLRGIYFGICFSIDWHLHLC